VDSRKTNKKQEETTEESLHEHIIAAMCDGCRLYFVFDEVLDTDLQPSPADFSVFEGETRRVVRACTLKAAVRKAKSWSLISLLLDEAVTPGTQITIQYHPNQWFMWSLETEESIEPFESTITVSATGALRGVNLEVDNQNLEAVPDAGTVMDAEPDVEFAFERRIKITFNKELDITHQPKPENFRAESEESWLEISSVYLAHAGKSKTDNTPWPELWLMFRDNLEPGSNVEIGYKAPEKGLRTLDGAAVNSFRVRARVSRHDPDLETDATNDSQIMPAAPDNGAYEEENQGKIVKLFSEEQKEEASSPAEYENPYAKKEEEKDASKKDSEQESEDDESLPDNDFDEFSFDPALEEEPIQQGPRQVIRTYLKDGSSITLDEEDLAAEIQKMQAESKLESTQTVEPVVLKKEAVTRPKRGKFLAKLAKGLGLFIVFWIAAAAIVYGLKLVGIDILGGGDTSATPQQVAGEQRKPCQMEYHDGSRYEGECLGNKRDGGGVYYWKSGDIYKGDWVQDRQEGSGMLQHKNGDVYTGSFKNNQKHGMGAMKWASGARYQGSYKNGKFDGKGTYWSPNGTRFEGRFQDGHTTAEGTCFLADGSTKEGACPQ